MKEENEDIINFKEEKMKRIVIGISGSSGSIYGIRMLEALKGKIESHLIISQAAKDNISRETSYTIDDVMNLATFTYDNNNLTAPISSGSFQTDGMVIIPCSIKSLSAIANSFNDSLISRAADVTLKERRKLILAVRETPFHLGHLKLMMRVTEMGGIICPPIPAFYYEPETINDLIDHSIGKILDILEIEHSLFKRWEGIK